MGFGPPCRSFRAANIPMLPPSSQPGHDHAGHDHSGHDHGGHGHDHDHTHGGAAEGRAGPGERPHPAVAIQRRPHPRQHEHKPGSAAAFRWSLVLNSALSGLQLAIGFAFGSLALVGDAVHNLGDVAGLLLGWAPSGSAAGLPTSASPMATAAPPSWPPW